MYIKLLNQPYRPGEFIKLIPSLLVSLSRPSRITNLLKLIRGLKGSKASVNTMPSMLMIETTNKCNLACPMCARTLYQNERKHEDLDIKLFSRIIEEVRESVFLVMLWNYGEPFCCENLHDFISICKSNKIFTMITTNGLLLDEDHINMIIEAKLDYLKISAMVHKEQDIYTYKTLLKLIKKTKGRRSGPFIDTCIILENQPVDLLRKIHISYKKAGSDCVSFRRIDHHYKTDKGSRWKILRHLNYNDCLRLKSLMVINSNGICYPCCYDFKLQFPMGNINYYSVRELWQGRSFDDFRKNYRKGNLPSICINCHSPDFNQKAYLTKKDLKIYE